MTRRLGPASKIVLITVPTRNPPTGEEIDAIRMQAVPAAKKKAAAEVAAAVDDKIPFLVEVMGGPPARGPAHIFREIRTWALITSYLRRDNVDFDAVNRAALRYLPSLVRTWAPDGRMCGAEWIARNPTRPDETQAAFSINVRTGKWADFATGDKGGDVISLAAYVFRCRQIEAARTLAATLGVEVRQ